MVDYTAALRYSEPPCEARALRRGILTSEDGLFIDSRGGYSSWLRSILKRAKMGPGASFETASAKEPLKGAAYELALADTQEIGRALQDSSVTGAKRAGLLCRRGGIYERLAGAHRHGVGLISASREAPVESRFATALEAVAAVEGTHGVVAATALDVGGEVVLLTSSRLLLWPEEPAPEEFSVRFRHDREPRSAKLTRWDLGADLAILNVDLTGVEPLRLSEEEPRRAARLYAVGHPEQGGNWSVTHGLVSGEVKPWEALSGESAFETDALIAPGSAGGPVLSESGSVVGLGVVVPKEDGVLVSGPALTAAAVRDWLNRDPSSDRHEAAMEAASVQDQGTGAILTPAGGKVVPAGTLTEASIQGVCVAYCDGPPRSTYSSGGGSSGGGDAIVGLAFVMGAAVAGVGMLLWIGLKALAKNMPRLSGGSGARWKTSNSSTASIQPVQKEKPKPEPKRAPRLHVELEGPTRLTPGDTYDFTAVVKSDIDGAKLDGVEISITQDIDSSSLKLTTGKDGRATFRVAVRSPNVAFRDLDRQAGLVRASAAVAASPQVLQLSTMGAGFVLTAAILGIPVGALVAGASATLALYLLYSEMRELKEQPEPTAPAQRSSPNTVQQRALAAQDALDLEAAASESDESSDASPDWAQPMPPEPPEGDPGQDENRRAREVRPSKFSGKKVSDILPTKKAAIKNAPPSWEEFSRMTWPEIVAGARANKPGFKTVRKLLTDSRFDR